jgi:hypothetical protein
VQGRGWNLHTKSKRQQEQHESYRAVKGGPRKQQQQQ